MQLKNNIGSSICFYRNLPHDGMAKENKRKACSSPREKNEWSHHQRLYEENIRKPKKRSVNFKNKGLGVVYA